MPKKLLIPMLMVCVCFPHAAMGVIISTTTGADGTVPYDGFPYWDNVGIRGIGSGVYLGNRWVLTASHVGAGPITLRGTSYSDAPGSVIRLFNSDSTPTDLLLYRIDTDPGIQALPLVSGPTVPGDTLVMIGAGYDRQAPLYHWDSSWHVTTGKGSYSGYYWNTASRTMRWGVSYLERTGQVLTGAYGTTNAFDSRFDSSGDSMAMAAAGDSGGAVFRYTETGVSLAGIMLAISTFGNQPAGTAVFDNKTSMADLYAYRSQLMPLDGDANLNGIVDQDDYKIWYDNYGTGSSWRQGDWNSDGRVDQADYEIWYDNYGAHSPFVGAGGPGDSSIIVPEPLTALLLICAGPVLLRRVLADRQPGVTCSKASARRGR